MHSIKKFLVFIVVVNSAKGADICRDSVRENGPTFCNSGERLPATTYRFRTIRDLAWFLTPRTYFLTNGNQFTYTSIHEALLGRCAPDKKSMERMRVHASFAFGDLTLSAVDLIQSRRKYMHLTCTPIAKDVQGIWSTVTNKLKRNERRPLDWTAVEEALLELGARNPHLEDAVQDLARFRCQPHPLCRPDSPFCSAGTDPSILGDVVSAITWTDHISNTTATGSAFSLLSCINKEPAWMTFSTVPQQGRDSIDDFWNMAEKFNFTQPYFARQNYLEDFI